MGERVPIPFGGGLDRESGIQVARRQSMEDLRNVYLRQGKAHVRKGITTQTTLQDPAGEDLTEVIAGEPLLGGGTVVVVGYQGNDNGNDHHGKVFVYELASDASASNLLGEWFRVPSGARDQTPTVSTAEVYGVVFLAHAETSADRAATVYYDPTSATNLETLTDWDGDDIYFYGVCQHMDYLMGWGYGGGPAPRPELVRNSVPANPTTFKPEHYAIVGSRGDPVVTCESASHGALIMFKETESYTLVGSGVRNFGVQDCDLRYGCLGPRLVTSVAGRVFFWSDEGPRQTAGEGSQDLSFPLALDEFEPADLATAGAVANGWADYIPSEQLVVFFFGARGYVLNVRRLNNPRWSYWELPFAPPSGFQVYQTGAAGTQPPSGHADFTWESTDTVDDDTARLRFNNENQDGNEQVEIWRNPVPNLAHPDWIHRPTDSGDGTPSGWSKGGAATANYSIEDQDGDGQDDSQKIEVTGGSAGQQRYIEKIISDGVTAGQTYRISAQYLAENLSNLEGRIEIAFRDGGGSVLGSPTEVTGLTDAEDGIRAYIEDTAPANTVDVRVRLIAHCTGSPGGSLYFRHVLVHDTADEEGWELADLVPVQNQTQTPEVDDTSRAAGWYYEFAVRHKRNAQYTSGYQSSDPHSWPDESKAVGKNDVTAPTLDEAKWTRTGGTRIVAPLNYTPHMEMPHRPTVDGSVESGPGTFTPSSSQVGQQSSFVIDQDDGTISPETDYTFRVEAVHPDGVQVIESNAITRWMGPETPLIENIIAGPEEAQLHWKIQEGDESYGTPPDSEVKTEISNDIDGLNNYGSPTNTGATTGLDTYATQNDGTMIDFRVRHLVENFGVQDRSQYAVRQAEVGAGGF